MKLEAEVKTVSGRTKHYVGTVVDGVLKPAYEIGSPDRVEIIEEGDGYFLFGYAGPGPSIFDSFFFTLEEAKRQAKFEFEIDEQDWVEILD